ncbi:MAG: hypothetical protein QW562_07590 [Thermosphaera sp.]
MGGVIRVPLIWLVKVAEMIHESGVREYVSIGYCPVGSGVAVAYFGLLPRTIPIAARISFNNGNKVCDGGDSCLNLRCPLNRTLSTKQEDIDTARMVHIFLDEMLEKLKQSVGEDLLQATGSIIEFDVSPLRYYVKNKA